MFSNVMGQQTAIAESTGGEGVDEIKHFLWLLEQREKTTHTHITLYASMLQEEFSLSYSIVIRSLLSSFKKSTARLRDLARY